MLKLAVLFFLWFAPPEVNVNWEGARPELAVRIGIAGDQSQLKDCVRSGLEARFRFEMRLCYRRHYWWDDCDIVRREIRSVEFDAINESYRVSSDRLNDDRAPLVHGTSAIDEAFSEAVLVRDVPLSFLNKERRDLRDSSRFYVAARVLSDCRSEYSQTLERISNVISLGLLRTSGFDSGWIAFSPDQ